MFIGTYLCSNSTNSTDYYGNSIFNLLKWKFKVEAHYCVNKMNLMVQIKGITMRKNCERGDFV